ncbi:hypothetical protein [Yoonia sp.]|uniref:hypothetical protein n=1 Tax=Yoonia sp. TaxID=2212373 RepID=UPI00238B1FD6|nr:hypothetical protein [Yoonia sp.]MDE0851219.1 hypothetical protein [Yoonia sp.]
MTFAANGRSEQPKGIGCQADRHSAFEQLNVGQIDRWCWHYLKRLRVFNLHGHKIHAIQIGQNKLARLDLGMCAAIPWILAVSLAKLFRVNQSVFMAIAATHS